MKRLVLTLVALGAATSLAACQKPADTPPAEAADTGAMASTSADMSKMEMGAGAKMAQGTGTVTAVSADSITIDHQPIPEAGWPAMTMAFKASPDLAKSVKAGDKIDFDLKLQDGGGEVTAISRP